MSKLYLGVDPDLRLLNMAVLHDKTVEAVFLRHNHTGKGETAVAAAAVGVAGVLDDFIRFITSRPDLQTSEVVLVVESQNMEHARHAREKAHRKVNYQDILTLGQIAGIWMGAFSEIAYRIVLVQAIQWKGQVPKHIHHQRIYSNLRWPYTSQEYPEKYNKTNSGIVFPFSLDNYCRYSKDSINPGDFMDINDSLGLALYGAEKDINMLGNQGRNSPTQEEE